MTSIVNNPGLLGNIRQNTPYALFFFAFFYAVYGGSSYLTSQRDRFYAIDFAWEQFVPFVPEMAVIYLTSGVLLTLLVFMIRSEYEIRVALGTLMIVTTLGAVVFALLPVAISFPERQVAGWAAIPFTIADTLNLEHNELPSLHVALSFTAAFFLSARRKLAARIAFNGWAASIAIAAMLMHEHHFLDVVSGFFLAVVVYVYFAKPRLLKRRDVLAEQTSPGCSTI